MSTLITPIEHVEHRVRQINVLTGMLLEESLSDEEIADIEHNINVHRKCIHAALLHSTVTAAQREHYREYALFTPSIIP